VIGPALAQNIEMIYPFPPWDSRQQDLSWGTLEEKFAVVLICIASVISVGMAVTVVIYRENRHVVKSSPVFIVLFLFGVLSVNLSTITWMPRLVTQGICYARIWTGPIFFLLTFLPQAATGWRIAVLFSPKAGLKVYGINAKRLGLLLALVMITSLIFLMSGISGVTVTVVEPVAHQAIHDYSICTGGPGFIPILSIWVAFTGVLLIAGIVIMTWVRNRTRNSIGREYDQSDSLWYSVFTSGVVLLIILLSQFIVGSGRPETSFVILYVSIFIGTMIQVVVILTSIFKPIYYRDKASSRPSTSAESGTALQVQNSRKEVSVQ
jgi:hypothetical protein